MKTRIQIYQNTIAIAATKMHSLQETILSFCAQKKKEWPILEDLFTFYLVIHLKI